MGDLAEILSEAAPVINEAIKQHFAAQGHSLTGAWEQSITTEQEPNGIAGYALNYGAIVDAGTKPDRIPFNGTGGGGAGTSKYIQGLFTFWKLRKPELTDKEALSLAFATAKMQKKQGMSTWASRDYSENKERQRFISEAFVAEQSRIDSAVLPGIDNFINEHSNEDKILTW